MRYEVEVRGFSFFERLPQNYATVVNGAFRRLMADIQKRARENTTRGRPGLIARKGNLYRSIKLGPYRQFSVGGYGEQRVYSDLFYSAVHEPPDGRRQTIITAKRKPYLRFRVWLPSDVTAPSGPWVSRKSVIIPARPFLAPAVEAAVRLWPEYVQESLRFVQARGAP
jgi:hypothetical protein